jgi:hypothetical protein
MTERSLEAKKNGRGAASRRNGMLVQERLTGKGVERPPILAQSFSSTTLHTGLSLCNTMHTRTPITQIFPPDDILGHRYYAKNPVHENWAGFITSLGGEGVIIDPSKSLSQGRNMGTTGRGVCKPCEMWSPTRELFHNPPSVREQVEVFLGSRCPLDADP